MTLRTPARCFAALLLVAAAAATPAAAPPLVTPLEHAQFSRISTSAEMSAFLDEVAATVPFARKEVVGASAQGRAIEALVFSTVAAPAPPERMTILITGSQHGAAEPAGGEALLVIARELALGDLRPLLDDADVVLLPNANPDGRDIGRRANANGVNINTDFVLAEQPETRVLKQVLARYRPEAVLDSHESAVLKRKTLARDGYLTDFEAQFEIANVTGVPVNQRRLAEDDLLPALLAAVNAEGLRAHRYIGEITSIHQPITNGGLTLRNFRNTAGVGGALSFLVETKLDSREDTYPTYRNIGVRLGKQLVCLRAFLRLAHARRADILAALQAPANNRLPLYAGYRLDPDHPEIDIPLRRLDTRALETLTFRDHRLVEHADEITLPSTYVVTGELERLRAVLDVHGIRYVVADTPRPMRVVASRFAPQANITERVETLASETIDFTAPPGSLIIDVGQRLGRAAALLLDPRSTSSVFRYPAYAALIDPAEPLFVYPVFKGVATATP